jgi:hypothetical protein
LYQPNCADTKFPLKLLGSENELTVTEFAPLV